MLELQNPWCVPPSCDAEFERFVDTVDMLRPERRCVKCGRLLRYREIRVVGPFPCSGCQTQLQAVETYIQVAAWGGVLLSVVAFYIAGLRDLRLICAVLLTFVPIVFVSGNFLKYLVPPRIERYLPKDTTLRLHE
jgi:hypothetical protein